MRKLKPQLERIDIDELFNNSSNRGMLSFLERPPEEAQALLKEKQRVNVADSQRLQPIGDLPPVGNSRTQSVREAPLPFHARADKPSTERALTGTRPETYPQGDIPLDSPYPVRESLPDVTHILDRLLQHRTPLESICPEGKLPSGQNPTPNPGTPSQSTVIRPKGELPLGAGSASLDGSIIGRRQKIRRASVAQDGHSSGEQLLYQSLWNAARSETQETRLLCVGYNGMSALCKLDRSNCKKNILSLIEKLSVQVAETYESASSTGTTYRIFSYKEILRRREAAGMVWVIRTSGVRFVNPDGNLPTPPVGDLPLDRVGISPTVPVSKTPIPPVGKTPTPLGKNKNSEGITTSAPVHEALSKYGQIDDEALTRLLRSCKARMPDCTEDEIVHFIHEKGHLVKARESRIQSPIGFLIDAVPKCFAGETFRLWRQAHRRETPSCSVCGGTRRILRNPPPDTGEWGAIKAALAEKLSPGAYQNWFAQSFHAGLIDGELHVSVPNESTQAWIQEDYDELIREIIQSLRLPVTSLAFDVLAESERYEPCATCHPPATATDDREDRSHAREWGREHEAQLQDPLVPEEVKAFIRKCLKDN